MKRRTIVSFLLLALSRVAFAEVWTLDIGDADGVQTARITLVANFADHTIAGTADYKGTDYPLSGSLGVSGELAFQALGSRAAPILSCSGQSLDSVYCDGIPGQFRLISAEPQLDPAASLAISETGASATSTAAEGGAQSGSIEEKLAARAVKRALTAVTGGK